MSVTSDDRSMIVYFIQEKGDIRRWSQWEERKPDISEEYPELISVLAHLNVAERTLQAIVEKIDREDP